MFNFKQMMQQAQQMQFKMQELQEKLKDIEVEGRAAEGMVKIVIDCSGATRSVAIEAALVKPDDKDTLEDLVLVALNEAHKAKEDRVKAETEALMASLGLPKGAKLPF